MTPNELWHSLRGLGVELRIDAGRLKVDAPKGAFTSELRTALAEQKDSIVALLLNQQNEVATPENQSSDLGLDRQELLEIEHLILNGSSERPVSNWPIVLSQTEVAERILEQVTNELISPNSFSRKKLQVTEWTFDVCIHHARENDYRDFGKSGPDEHLLRGECQVDELISKIHEKFAVRFVPIFGYINPFWNWSLELSVPTREKGEDA